MVNLEMRQDGPTPGVRGRHRGPAGRAGVVLRREDRRGGQCHGERPPHRQPAL